MPLELEVIPEHGLVSEIVEFILGEFLGFAEQLSANFLKFDKFFKRFGGFQSVKINFVLVWKMAKNLDFKALFGKWQFLRIKNYEFERFFY